MPLIHICAAGVESDVDASTLKSIDTIREDDRQRIHSIEYCLLVCDGPAHATGIPDTVAHFCDRHVHRSVHVDVKVWPEGMGALIGGFG